MINEYKLTLEHEGQVQDATVTIDNLRVQPDSLAYHMLLRMDLQNALDTMLLALPLDEDDDDGPIDPNAPQHPLESRRTPVLDLIKAAEKTS